MRPVIGVGLKVLNSPLPMTLAATLRSPLGRLTRPETSGTTGQNAWLTVPKICLSENGDQTAWPHH